MAPKYTEPLFVWISKCLNQMGNGMKRAFFCRTTNSFRDMSPNVLHSFFSSSYRENNSVFSVSQCSIAHSSCADSYPFRTLLPGQLINHTMWTGCKHEVKEQLTWPSVCRSVCGQIKLSRDQFIIMNLAVSHRKLCWAQRTVATAAV